MGDCFSKWVIDFQSRETFFKEGKRLKNDPKAIEMMLLMVLPKRSQTHQTLPDAPKHSQTPPRRSQDAQQKLIMLEKALL